MCNCKQLPDYVYNIWREQIIELQGIKLFPEYFSGLEAEEFEPELSFEHQYFKCKECGQEWYIFLDCDEIIEFAIKVESIQENLSQHEIRAVKEFLTILAHNGFEPEKCRVSGCNNLKLKGKEFCHKRIGLS